MAAAAVTKKSRYKKQRVTNARENKNIHNYIVENLEVQGAVYLYHDHDRKEYRWRRTEHERQSCFTKIGNTASVIAFC